MTYSFFSFSITQGVSEDREGLAELSHGLQLQWLSRYTLLYLFFGPWRLNPHRLASSGSYRHAITAVKHPISDI